MQTGTNPPDEWVSVTKSDTTVFAAFRSLYCGSDGDVYVRDLAGNIVGPIPAVKGGYILGYFDQVRASTTVSPIFGLR